MVNQGVLGRTRVRMLRPSKKTDLGPYGFVLPHLILFVVFMVLPVVAAFATSFTDWAIVGPVQWVGLGNYAGVLQDPSAQRALRVTLTYTVATVPTTLVVSLILALLVNREQWGNSFFRLAFFAPWVLPSAVVAMVWKWMLQPGNGVLDYYLSRTGLISSTNWLGNPNVALYALAVVWIWWSAGYGMVIYLAALQDIPQEFYDAAAIDGANGWQRFWYITFPMLTAATSFLVILSTISAMRAFDLFFLMTQGGPGGSTSSVVFQIWQSGFIENKMGFAATMSVLLFVAIFLLALVEFRFVRERAEVG